MDQVFFQNYLLPLIWTAVAAVAGWVGLQVKKLAEKYINTKIKKAVVKTAVEAVEQLWHDLSGAEKFEKAKEGAVDLLNEKGIPITDLELSLLIESAVSEFNYGLNGKKEGNKDDGTATPTESR